MNRAPQPECHALSWGLMICGLVLYVGLSGPTLGALGWLYEVPGGSGYMKIHPGTYLICLGGAFGLVAWGNPLQVAGTLAQQAKLPAFYLACMVTTGVWALWRHGSAGAAFFVDSLWMPGVALLLLPLHPRARHRQLLHLLGALLGANALMAVVEAALAHPLLPQYHMEGVMPDVYFRSNALLGHPLTNALVTASLLPMLWVLPMGMLRRAAVGGLVLLSLLAFGGRTAFLLSVGVYGLAGALAVAYRALKGSYTYLQLMGGVMLLMGGLAVVVGVVLATGLGERIFANLIWDNSANVRLMVWDALNHLDNIDWWIGVSPARIDTIATQIGLDLRYEGIENFWLAIFLQVGLIGFIPFLLGLAAGLAHLARNTPNSMLVGVLVFFVVGSGANTLASKTVAMTLLFVASQCASAFFPRRDT